MSAHTNPGTYPGNPSLPAEVKEKILSTFRHTLNLFGEGKLDDCIIGCDFILKMDARFAPARQLLEKARNPASAIDVAQLEALVATTPTRQERVVAADPERLLVRAVESFNARDFDAAIAAAEQVLQVLPGNQDAREILEKATRKKTSQPVFDGSRQRALAALDSDRPEDARRELEQMRSLDPDHPAVALLERRIPGASKAAPLPPKFAEPKRPVPPPPPDFGGLDFDMSEPSGTEPSFGPGAAGGGFGGESNEPDIRFDDGATVSLKIPPAALSSSPPPPNAPGGLDALSLDSLSLDLPPAVSPVTPPAGGRSGLGGPLQNVPPPPPPPLARPIAPPPPPPPPSNAPPDLWSEGSGGLDLEEPLEEPPPYAPSSEPPPPPPPMFSTASNADLEEEEARAGEREIAALLKQGDDAARRGDRQQAIEVWSRIFLIDINNSEAVTRIEKARQDMAEGNRVISEGLKSGREIYERGDLEGAREIFLQVLTADESEPTARFYLDRIQEELANPGAAAEAAAAEAAAGTGAAGTAAKKGSAAEAAAAARERPASRKVSIPPLVLAVVGVFAVLVLAGVYFFVLRAPKGGRAAAGAAAGPAGGSLAHARQLLGTGKIGEARAELRRVPPSSPDYAEAQKTLAELGKPAGEAASGTETGAPMSVASETGAPPPAPADVEPARLRALAERNLAEKRYIDAMKNFSQAASSFRNDPTFGQSMGIAAEKVTALTPAVKLYNEGEYETAIPILWRIYQEDRENQDAKSYLLRAYYNQGITQLQNGMYPKAIESFNEALTLDPADSETIRHRKFAERYQKTDLDLMGRIYVRHLNHRP